MNLPTNDIRTDNKEPEKLTGVGRRRFIHNVGAAVVPVIMTTHSTSSLAGVCLSPSATASIALLHSRENRAEGTCLGRTPGYWSNAKCTHEADWLAAGQSGDGILFSTMIDVSGAFGDLNIRQVMSLSGSSDNSANNCIPDPPAPSGWSDSAQLGAHLVAAYLNLKMGWVTVITQDNLTDMWKNQAAYIPTPGATAWTPTEIVSYLKKSMTR